jgi:hypothetical protein
VKSIGADQIAIKPAHCIPSEFIERRRIAGNQLLLAKFDDGLLRAAEPCAN